MQSGAPTFGTPEPQLVLFVLAALARRLGVPFRSGGNFTASKVPDYQAAYEEALQLSPGDAEARWNLEVALRRLGYDPTSGGSSGRGPLA